MNRVHAPLLWRRMILLGTPLALTVLMLWHPAGGSATVEEVLLPLADWWLLLHVIQLPLLALMGAALYLLLVGIPGPAATVSRLAAAVFIVFYAASDAVVGIGTGILARAAAGVPEAECVGLIDAIRVIFRDPIKNQLFDLGIYGWIVALLAAAVTLWRAGVPRPPLALLPVAAYFLSGDHRAPFGSLAFGSFFLAAVWLELARVGWRPWSAARRSAAAEAAVLAPR